jgi:Flp pilus assembly protein TadG
MPARARSRGSGKLGRLRLIRRARDERGAAIVEFAIILPAFLLILLGVMDFGKVMYYFQASTQAASTGARQAAVDRWPDDDTVNFQSWVRSQLKTNELRADARVCVVFPDAATTPGKRVEVKVQVPYDIPLVNAFTGGNDLLVRTSATMRIEVDSAGASGVAIDPADDIGTCT